MSFVYVCLDPKCSTEQQNRIKLEFKDENISSITVDDLKRQLCSSADDRPDGLPGLPKNYHLTFFGRVLKPNNQLSNYGVKSGACLFVLPNDSPSSTQGDRAEASKKPRLEPAELQKMMDAIRTALLNPSFRTMLSKVYDRDFRDNIIECTPGLRENIVAFAILQDPDLMMMLCSTENDILAKISEKYSVFAEAAAQLAAAFHEEMIASSTQSNGSSTGERVFGQANNYSLQYDSDDDDLEGGVDAAPPAGQAVRETQPIIQNRITTDMVQQAIRAAAQADPLPSTSRQQPNAQANASPQTTASSSNPTFGSSPRFAFGAAPSATNQPSASTPATSQTSGQTSNQTRRLSRDWTQQLATMRELGLFNDAICIQALEACNGNVQEAINLYFVLNNQGD